MSSADVSRFSAQAPPSSIDPRRLQQPVLNHRSSEEHDSFNDSIDQSFLASYQSMKNSSSSSPSAIGTSGDYSSGYDANNDFAMMEDDYLSQVLGPYAGDFNIDDNVIPSIEAPTDSPAATHNEHASSPPQSNNQQNDRTAFVSSKMAPNVPPRSPMRARTPQISVSTDMGHPQSAHDIDAHSFQLGRQDSTPINATPSPSIAVGMWNSETMQEIHTPMHGMAQPHHNGYFSPQHSPPAAISTMDNNLIDSHVGTTWGDDGSGRQGINPERRSQKEALNFKDLEKAKENERRLSIVQSWMAREDETHSPVDTAAGVDEELRKFTQGRGSSSMANSPHSSYYSTSFAGTRDPESQHIETPDDTDISHLRPLPPAADTAPTVNQVKEGQVYINPNASALDTRDMELLTLGTGMLRLENDAPISQAIMTADHGGMTSSFAMEQYRKAADNFSMLSRRATWGTTRRMSDSDIEGGRRVNLLKRLSIKKEAEGGEKKPGLFNRAVALARKTSQSSTANKLKRNRFDAGISPGSPLAFHQGTSPNSLVPPPSLSSERRRSRSPAVPRLETNIGDLLMPYNHPYHSRRASASNISPTSSIVGDFVRQIRGRSRSKSDSNRGGSIAAQWQREGGPPVVTPSPRDNGGPATISAQGDSDAEGDDDYEEEFRPDENGDNLTPQLQLQIEPTMGGFRQNILVLNPNIKSYLVDRFAHQQSARYKGLLRKRIDHEAACQNGTCPSGPKFCLKMGGQPCPLVPKTKGRNARVANIDDGSDSNPENKLGQENFPAGIPMPPTDRFPAELECPYCFVVKKFQKPSDWTKHIQEDVAPFTCTWAGCKDARSFKRKADYVRHENEKHRHIESWSCNIDDCAHVCHRKDNFQAHLVREHRMKEPTARNKADIQKALGYDAYFWGIVDKCHQQSSKDAVHEPCKFCGKSFSTFKKLSGHEAKHMEQISLPIIHLVESRHIDTNTIISPVGPPPVSQQPDTPNDMVGASPFSQTHTTNHMSPGSEYGQYPDPNMPCLGIGDNPSQFQPNYGMGGPMRVQQQHFGMVSGTAPIPIQGHRYNTTSPMQHAHSRSYGEISPLAQQLQQFEMGNHIQYGQGAARSMSSSYGSSMDPSNPPKYAITSAPLAGFVGAPTTMAGTTAGHPANFGMPTVGGQGQYSMAHSNNTLFGEVDPIDAGLARIGQVYVGAGQQRNFVQNNLGQAQFGEDMAMHRSHSDSNMMPNMHHNQQQYQACMQPVHQFRQSVGGYQPQPQHQLQNWHPGQQAARPRSTSGGNRRLRDGFMQQQQQMRPN